MRFLLTAAFVMSSTTLSLAGTIAVPEIDTSAGLVALGVVGAVAALIWERRR